MSTQELEVKILDISQEQIVNKLQSLQAKEVFSGTIIADFFKNAAGLKIRLRRMDNKNVLTYKIVRSQDEIRHNEEIEVSFDNYEGLKQVLLEVGFEQYGHSEKTRLSFEYQGIHFDIDNMSGIPTFLEVEASTAEKVKEGVELLGYTMSQTSTFTERTLKEHYGVS